MKSIALSLVVGMVHAASAGASEAPTATYSDPLYGFSLEVPELGSSEGALFVQRVAFAAAPRDGFAVNCNVQVQFLEMKMPAYVDMSLRQFDAAGLELLRNESQEVSGRAAALLEYSGTVGGVALRFLALAVGGENRFWLVTCAAPADVFDAHRPKFVELLDSFEVEPPG